MDVDGAAKLLEATAKLVGAEVWPAVIGYILVRFRSNIGDFIFNLGELTLKGAGVEASITQKQTEARAALVAATISRFEGGTIPANSATALKEAALAVGEVNARILRRMDGSHLLWVDDRPDNNNHERHALEILGIKVAIFTSTDDALSKLQTRQFDAIISDMGRSPDAKAGYTLLDRLRSSGSRIPFIIYPDSRSPEHQAEAIRRGAIGCTNSATELFQMVVLALQQR